MNETGFALFGRGHLAWLAGLALLAALLIRLQKRERGEGKVRRAAALACLLVHLAWSLDLVLAGSYDRWALPCHLCGLAFYLCPVHALLTGKGRKAVFLSEVLFCPLMPGLAAALLFPGWQEAGILSPESLVRFLTHGLALSYILLCLLSGTIRPSVRRIRMPLLFLALYAGLILPFDLATGTNYGFLRVPAPGFPLETLERAVGAGVPYMAAFCLLAVLVTGFWYMAAEGIRRIREYARKGDMTC